MKFQKKDGILLGAFLLAGVVILILVLTMSKPGEQVQVRVDGRVVKTFSLSEDVDFVIDGATGGTNRLIIRDGVAWMEEASCPDGLCMGMGKISKTGQSIICLPNKVVVEIIGGENEVDITT